MPPALWELIAVEPPYRVGYVFKLPRSDGEQTTTDQCVKAISRICKAAGVVLDAATAQTAVSRDISGGAARESKQ